MSPKSVVVATRGFGAHCARPAQQVLAAGGTAVDAVEAGAQVAEAIRLR